MSKNKILKEDSVEQENQIPVEPIEETLEKEVVTTSDYNLEIVRDYYGNVDPFYLSRKDPNYSYRFLRDESKNITHKTGNLLFQKGGWQIVPSTHLKKLGFKDKDLSPDGMLRRGDQILAFMPIELYKEKEKQKVEKANAPMKQVRRVLKHGDPDIGGKEIHETMKGIQTQKALGM